MHPDIELEEHEDWLYRNSEPLPQDYPVLKRLHRICGDAGIEYCPQIRVLDIRDGGISINFVGITLPATHSIVLQTPVLGLPGEVIDHIFSHELAHYIFGHKDRGYTQHTYDERQADRFALFLTGTKDAAPIVSFLNRLKERVDDIEKENIDHRIAQLEKPLTGFEIREFTRAIRKYNSRMTKALASKKPFTEFNVDNLWEPRIAREPENRER